MVIMTTVTETRTCSSCTRQFVPSSRHKTCPRCRSGARWSQAAIPCEICGHPCGSGRCKNCAGISRRAPIGTVRSANGKGYSAIKIAEPDLWKLEHRYVMENMIGRDLIDGENVHHKNGKRDDNRPENLELWVTLQPSGQRPEDLLVYAHEIIRRYG